MYYPAPILTCSKCGSTKYEGVTQGNSRFTRCLSCGHEGSKTDIMPPMDMGGFKYQVGDAKVQPTF